MKTKYIIQIVLVLIFYCSGTSFADNWKNESGKGHSGKSNYHNDDRDDRGYKNRSDDHGRHEVHGRPDYRGYHGYKSAPYDRGRHYGRYKYNNHQYEYHGHWRSWDQWERYAKQHPHIYEHGHYYRENTHLMFRYSDPGTGECFFFSIGK